jgi:hypothetical protein
MPIYRPPEAKATETVTFRLTKAERVLFDHLARRAGLGLTALFRELLRERAAALGIEEAPEPAPRNRPGRPRREAPPPPREFRQRRDLALPTEPTGEQPPEAVAVPHRPKPVDRGVAETFGELARRYRETFANRAEGTRRELDETLEFLTGRGDYPALIEEGTPLARLDSELLARVREAIRTTKLRLALKNLHLTYLRMMLHYGLKEERVALSINPAADLRAISIIESPDGWPAFAGAPPRDR